MEFRILPGLPECKRYVVVSKSKSLSKRLNKGWIPLASFTLKTPVKQPCKNKKPTAAKDEVVLYDKDFFVLGRGLAASKFQPLSPQQPVTISHLKADAVVDDSELEETELEDVKEALSGLELTDESPKP